MENIFNGTTNLKDKKLPKEELDTIVKVLSSCFNGEFEEYVKSNIDKYKEIKKLVDNLNYLGFTFWSSDNRLLLTSYGENIFIKLHSKNL